MGKKILYSDNMLKYFVLPVEISLGNILTSYNLESMTIWARISDLFPPVLPAQTVSPWKRASGRTSLNTADTTVSGSPVNWIEIRKRAFLNPGLILNTHKINGSMNKFSGKKGEILRLPN